MKIRSQLIADLYLTLFPPTKGAGNQSGIAIVDTFITKHNNNAEKDPAIQINERQFFTSAYYPDFVLLEKLKPDGYIRRRKEDGMHHGLLFLIDTYIPQFLLKYTFQSIFTTLDEEDWEDNTVLSLNLYFLCPNNSMIIYMKNLLLSHMQNYYGKKELMFHFSTRKQLNQQRENPEQKMKWQTVSSEDSTD